MILHGDCLEELKKLPDDSIDSVVTDPPYGLSKEPNITEVLTKWMSGEDYLHRSSGFMGKSWDSFVPGPSIWKEVYRVLKPGGHILCFAGTRTQDLITIALRLAGFEVRDCISYLYFSGFPKSKSNLKPAHEPIILARKPLEKTVVYNVEKYGTGSINIEACRIGRTADDRFEYGISGDEPSAVTNGIYGSYNERIEYKPDKAGRFPANCITIDEDQFYSKYFNITPQELSKKASKKDRNSDWKGEEIKLTPKAGNTAYGVRVCKKCNSLELDYEKSRCKCVAPEFEKRNPRPSANNHPTVKPINLMAWLIRLITPQNGIVLDPFAGSGSTLVAAKREGFQYIGIEKEAEYIEIINARIS